MKEELIAKIRNCEVEAEHCRRLTADESLPLNERVGAQMGELDWIVSAQMYREDLDLQAWEGL